MHSAQTTEHWKKARLEPQATTHTMHCTHERIASLPETVYLTRGRGLHTGYEDFPEDVADWLAHLDAHHPDLCPTLLRLYSDTESLYAFAYRYDPSQERGSEPEAFRPTFTMSYNRQLQELLRVMQTIQERIPQAMPRLLEQAGLWGRHILEILFPYPTPGEVVLEAGRVLCLEYPHITGIGVTYKGVAHER